MRGTKKGREMLRGGEGKKLRQADTRAQGCSVCMCVHEHVYTYVSPHSSTLALDAALHMMVVTCICC